MTPGARPDGASALCVVDLRTWILDIPLIRPHKFATAEMDTQAVLLVRLEVEDGTVGWGEGVVPGGPWWGGESIEGMEVLVNRYLAPQVIGHDVLGVEALALRLAKVAGGAPFARAGVEMAAWDAAGRALGVPVHQLLGGRHRDRLPVTWAMGAEPADVLVAEAQHLLDTGRHGSFKLKMGAMPAEQDVLRVAKVAEAIGDRARISVDLNGSWDEHAARRWLPVLAEAGVTLVEQPLPAAHTGGLASLRDNSSLAIMADESVWTASDAIRIAQDRSADAFALKIAKSGGIRSVRQVAAVAEAAGIGCYGGTTIETSLGTAASAHVFSSTASLDWGTELFGPLILADDITNEPAVYRDGNLLMQAGPGFGVTIDEDKVAKYGRV
ncbi:MAG: muconate cycloisomerase family protein [Aeromicrobium sp.]